MQLSQDQERRLREVADRFGISLVVAFGSAVTGLLHPKSDLDLGLLFRDAPAAEKVRFGELLHELQEIFPGQELDIGLLDHADPLFLKKVTERCSLLFGAPRRLQELRLYAFKRYHDHRRYLDMERRFVKGFLESRAGRR